MLRKSDTRIKHSTKYFDMVAEWDLISNAACVQNIRHQHACTLCVMHAALSMDASMTRCCAYQRGSRTRSPCCRTKSSTEVRPGTWDPSCLCQISPVDGRCALRIPVGFSYRPTTQALDSRQPSLPGCRSPRLPAVWNALPEEITSSSSLMIFCRRLKAWLFRKSFPDIII